MARTKPNRVQYAWKYADQTFSDFLKSLLRWLDYDTDSNASTDGTQNPFNLGEVPFRADCPGVDVFAIGLSPDGKHETPGLKTST